MKMLWEYKEDANSLQELIVFVIYTLPPLGMLFGCFGVGVYTELIVIEHYGTTTGRLAGLFAFFCSIGIFIEAVIWYVRRITS